MSTADPRQTLGLSLGSPAPARRAVALPAPRRRNALTLDQLRKQAEMEQAVRVAVEKLKPDNGVDSIFGQFGDAITGLPAGIAHLAHTGAVTLASPLRLGRDLVTGKTNLPGLVNDLGTTTADYFPLVSEVQSSMNRTVMDIRHPTRLYRAYEDGQIVNKLLEDAGNVAIVLGPVSKGLSAAGKAAETAGAAETAARFASAAKVTERVAKLGGEVANAPMTATTKAGQSVYRTLGKGVAKVAETGFERALKSEGAIGAAADFVKQHASLRVTPEGKIAWDATREGWRKGNRIHSAVNRELYNLANDTGASMAEQGAAMALLNGVADLDQFASEVAARKGLNLSAEDVRRMHVLENRPEQTYSSEMQQVARAYRDGTLDQESRARVDAVMEGVKPILNRLENSALSGEGRARPLSLAQLGNDPLDEYVVAELRKVTDPQTGMPMFTDQTIAALTQMRMMGDSWFDLEQVIPELTAILDDPMVYPSKWRPVMVAAQRANKAGDASLGVVQGLDLPVRPSDLMDAGLSEPRYLPGGRSSLVDPRSIKLKREPLNLGMRGLQGVSADKVRIASEIQPYSLRTLADLASGTLRTVEFNKALLKFVQDPIVPTAKSLLGDQVMSAIDEQARKIAEAQVNRSTLGEARMGPPEQVLGPVKIDDSRFNFPNSVLDAHPADAKIGIRTHTAYREAYGQAVIDALAERGYEILAGDPMSPNVGDFDPGVAIATDRVTPDSIILPVGVKARLVQNMTTKPHAVLEILRSTNKTFKGAVLPFSVRWHLGDIVGGAFMAWVGGGIPPWELVRSMRELKNLSPDAANALLDHPDFVRQGLNFEESRWRSDGPAAAEPKTAIGRFQRKSFQFNETINRINREGFLLAKVQRLLDDLGLDMEQVGAQDLWDHPQVQDAITEAVAEANKVMGTFDELTPFESRYLKNVFPFYVWARHITTLAARTTIDNPARMVWTLRLGAYGMDTEDLPDWLKGSIGIPDALMPDFIAKGDVLMPTQFINPFNDVLNQPAFTPQGMMRSLAPAIKVGLAGGFGVEPGNSFSEPVRKITRPYGESRNPIMDALNVTLETFPVTRQARNLAPTGSIGGFGLGPVPRYHSGRNMVDKDGNPIDSKSRAIALLGLAGIPQPTPVEDARAIQAAAQKAETVKRRKKKKVVLG